MKGTVIDDYIHVFKAQSEKYGKKFALLYQVGDFYELYGTNQYGNVPEICKVLDIILSRKNKNLIDPKNDIVTRECPYFAGFPKSNYEKHTRTLLDAGYTVTLVEQVTPPPNVKREMTRTLSPSTFIDDLSYTPKESSHSLAVLYASKEKGYGISIIDLSIGFVKLNEISGNECDVLRYIENESPCEVCVYREQCIEGSLYTKLEHSFKDKLVYKESLRQFSVPAFQEHYLSKVFTRTGFLSTIEQLDLENKPNALTSFICGLHYIEDHDKSLIEKLHKPQIMNDTQYVHMNETVMYQLDIIPQYVFQKDSVFKLLHKTCTHPGTRLLKHRLLNPITSIHDLNNRYDCLEQMMNGTKGNGSIDTIRSKLKSLPDMERLCRKWKLSMLSMAEWYMHFSGCVLLSDIMNEVRNHDLGDYDMTCQNGLIEFIDRFHSTYIHDCLEKNGCQGYENIFKKGIQCDIDALQEEAESIIEKHKQKAVELCDLFSDQNSSQWVKLEMPSTAHNTWYLSVTHKRYESLKKTGSRLLDMYTAKKHSSTQVRLTSNELTKDMYTYNTLKDKMQKLVHTIFIDDMKKCNDMYSHDIDKCIECVTHIDVTQSLVFTSMKNGYTKPKLIESEHSFIKAEGLRHPIIEKSNMDSGYVENSIDLHDGEFGMLLYGLNGGGKSSLMKSVGICVILAQIGCYVPSSSVELSPFYSIFTRISGDDNIFKGHSSFQVEMMELRHILKNSNSHSLVLGDEICKGTEHMSALSIVGASLKKMCQYTKPRFIFATHLHELCSMDEIMNMDGMGVYHMSVELQNGNIIYNRKLEKGGGLTTYGLEVAEHILEDESVILDAHRIRSKLVCDECSDTQSLFSSNVKSSTYNTSVIVDRCEICTLEKVDMTKEGETLDVHHIQFQSHADENGVIWGDGGSAGQGVIHKNTKSNLVPLCEYHHDKVHHGSIIIHGYQHTANGTQLKYEMKNARDPDHSRSHSGKKGKYSSEQIARIMEYKKMNISASNACTKLQACHSIQISTSTIRKYWKEVKTSS